MADTLDKIPGLAADQPQRPVFLRFVRRRGSRVGSGRCCHRIGPGPHRGCRWLHPRRGWPGRAGSARIHLRWRRRPDGRGRSRCGRSPGRPHLGFAGLGRHDVCHVGGWRLDRGLRRHLGPHPGGGIAIAGTQEQESGKEKRKVDSRCVAGNGHTSSRCKTSHRSSRCHHGFASASAELHKGVHSPSGSHEPQVLDFGVDGRTRRRRGT